MRIAPRLNPNQKIGPVRQRFALLVNPFYAKDPHASFGKHVLTPTLALTTIAAATPETWEVSDWDENLLQGPPPVDPLPEVVGISHGSIWKRRPSDRRSVPPYLAMSYLYKRSNVFWHLLIRNRLTSLVWRPLVEITRRRHIACRRRLIEQDDQPVREPAIVSAGV